MDIAVYREGLDKYTTNGHNGHPDPDFFDDYTKTKHPQGKKSIKSNPAFLLKPSQIIQQN